MFKKMLIKFTLQLKIDSNELTPIKPVKLIFQELFSECINNFTDNK